MMIMNLEDKVSMKMNEYIDDLFSTEPKELTIQVLDSKNQLKTYKIKNVAMLINILSNTGAAGSSKPVIEYYKNVGTDSNLILEKNGTSLKLEIFNNNNFIVFKTNEMNTDYLTVKLNTTDYPVYYKDEQVEPGMLENGFYGLLYKTRFEIIFFNKSPEDILNLGNNLLHNFNIINLKLKELSNVNFGIN